MKKIIILLLLSTVGSISFCFCQTTNNIVSSNSTTLPITGANSIISVNNNNEEIIQNEPRKIDEPPISIKKINTQPIKAKEEIRENKPIPIKISSPN